MCFKLVPDFYFNSFSEVTVDFLLEHGIKGVLLDVDNTLEPYENPLPGKHVTAWLASLKENGISAAIVSNNNAERIDLFNSELGLPAYSKAGKPFAKNLRRAMNDIGTDTHNTILIGDQILTDILAAHNLGITGILVPPINDKKDLFTRFKRWLEKPIMKKYFKIQGDIK